MTEKPNGETTIEDILALEDASFKEVPIPQWGDRKIMVVSMTAEERSEMEKKWSHKQATSDPWGFRRDVLCQTVKKQDKTTPWGTPEQFDELRCKNAEAIETLFEAGCSLSGLRKKDIQELEGNS